MRSVLDQTYQDLELVVIDDGSTDGTGALLDRLAERDSRMRVLHQPNRGLTRALIRGCSESRSELIARHDSDDWSHPERIADQVALIDSDSRIGFVSCFAEYVGPGGEFLHIVTRPLDPELATTQLLESKQGPPAHGGVLFRRSLYESVGGYRPEFYFAQDSDLWLRMGEQAWVAYVDKVRYRYRKDPSGISGSFRESQLEFAAVTHACRAARVRGLPEEPHLQTARALTERIRSEEEMPKVSGSLRSPEISYLIGSQLTRNGDARAVGYLKEVLRTRPWHLKAWVRMLQSFVKVYIFPTAR